MVIVAVFLLEDSLIVEPSLLLSIELLEDLPFPEVLLSNFSFVIAFDPFLSQSSSLSFRFMPLFGLEFIEPHRPSSTLPRTSTCDDRTIVDQLEIDLKIEINRKCLLNLRTIIFIILTPSNLHWKQPHSPKGISSSNKGGSLKQIQLMSA